MVKIKDISKNITKPVDTYLKFVQTAFNTNDINFMEILRDLDRFANSASETSRRQREELRARAYARKLRDELSRINILTDFDKYNKFNKLGDFGFSNKGLMEAYSVSEEIIKDIKVARNWIKSYKQFERLTQKLEKLNLTDNTDLHDELLLLGKSILGRAIELTPMKTGKLRRSAVLLDFGTYIIIAFTAPYATYVHENMELKHPHPHHPSNNDCGGQYKFLETALQEFFPDKTVWVEHHGFGGVQVKISLNPLYLEYKHYS